jgi:hypothetical protein
MGRLPSYCRSSINAIHAVVFHLTKRSRFGFGQRNLLTWYHIVCSKKPIIAINHLVNCQWLRNNWKSGGIFGRSSTRFLHVISIGKKHLRHWQFLFLIGYSLTKSWNWKARMVHGRFWEFCLEIYQPETRIAHVGYVW